MAHDGSAGGETIKPAPDTFLLAAKRLGIPPAECLVFEDAPTGIESARRAGMDWVLVPSARARIFFVK